MPSRCCVPGCKGNYDSTNVKLSIFKFPSDTELCRKWIRAIHRKDFKPSKSSRVCQLHFQETDIERETSIYCSKTGEKLTARLRTPCLREGAVPSLLSGCPSYLADSGAAEKRESPEEKALRLENAQLNLAIKLSVESKDVEDERNYFSDYDKFLNCIKEFKSILWTVIYKEDCTIFANINSTGVPSISSLVVINKELELKVFFRSVELKNCRGIQLPKPTNNFREISALLDYLETLSEDKAGNKNLFFDLIESLLHNITDENLHDKTRFLKEQLLLLKCQKHQQLRYSSQLTIFSALMYSISPHAYKFLRNSGNITLPHPTTIRKIISNLSMSPQGELLEVNFLKYIGEKVKHLNDRDKVVTLMMDEIHLKPYFDFKGGNVVGAAFDNNQAATSAHAFMVQSLLSNFKEVVFLMPVKTLTAETLHTIVKKVIEGLENIGFLVVAVVSDNNSINRKAMSLFSNHPQISTSYSHPVASERPLFYIIDAVHIFKCIRNNWLNQKNDRQCMYFPNFECLKSNVLHKLDTASFKTLKELHEQEHTNILKFGYGLTLKALNPSNLERQNVKLVLKVFNEHVITALNELGEKHNLYNCKSTASYIGIILNWWHVVNVKTPDKGKRLKNILMHPLTASQVDERRVFLQQFIDWMNIWEDSNCATGKLTSKTHRALVHTSCAILEMSKYCIEKFKMTYFLTGKVQTDSLEEQFGKYRMLAGSQYNISVRQLFESEAKLRLQNYLPLTLNSGSFGEIKVTKLTSELVVEEDSCQCDEQPLVITILDQDFKNIKDSLPVLVYIAGYCIYTVCKHLKCTFCEDQLTMDKELAIDECFEHITNLNRGGLKFPNGDVVKVVSYTYIVGQKLISSKHENTFLKMNKQRSFMSGQTIALLNEDEVFNELDTCISGHSPQDVMKRIVWITTNILLNNYCNSKNDLPKKVSKKRKLQTLEK